MNKVFGRLLVIGLATAGMATAGMAYADGFGHGGHGHGNLVPMIVRHYVSHDQIQAAVAPNAATLKSDYSAVKSARETLENDLIANNSSAIQNDIQSLETAQNNLLQEKVTVAEAILANLSSSQRTQVGNFVTAYRSLEQQNRQSRQALFQQYGLGPNSQSSDTSTPAAE